MIAVLPIPSAPPAPDPHLEAIRRLCAEIEGLASQARSPRQPEAASFGIVADSLEVFSSIRADVSRLLGDLRPTATVRTSPDTGESAVSVVTYTGLAASVWPTNPTYDLAITQLTSVQRVLTLRCALFRAVVAAAGALASLTVMAANPLALPLLLSTAKSLEDAVRRLVAAAEAAA